MTSKTLSTRLRERAEHNMSCAKVVSNLHKPESDNEFGRDATLQTEAADTIDTLQRENDSMRATLLETKRRLQRNNLSTHEVDHALGITECDCASCKRKRARLPTEESR